MNAHLPNGFTGNQPIRAHHLYLWTDNGPDMLLLIHWLQADSTVDSCAGEWSFTEYEIVGFEQAAPSQQVRGRWMAGVIKGSKVTGGEGLLESACRNQGGRANSRRRSRLLTYM